ncbi:hypothetical protein SO802_006032 [Lithocarpus litseifolius]|uniref:Uncharacterized protein n=1 Tax=Lithocarpus litseifolius TaxID=425828 RepID=A0AAW2DLB5_9ROSI
MVESIIKQTDIDPYVELETVDLWASGLFDLSKVKSVYPDLDLSRVIMDDPLSSTLAGDTIFEETDDLTRLEPEPKDDSVVLAQPAANLPITPLIPFVEPWNDEDSLPQDAPSKNDKNPPTLDAQDPVA